MSLHTFSWWLWTAGKQWTRGQRAFSGQRQCRNTAGFRQFFYQGDKFGGEQRGDVVVGSHIVQQRHRLYNSTSAACPGGAGSRGAGIYGGSLLITVA